MLAKPEFDTRTGSMGAASHLSTTDRQTTANGSSRR